LLRDVPNLGAIIDAILSSGDAIIIARTGDGGAIALTVLSDDGKVKSYAAGQDELDDAFAALAVAYDG
jgi:serine/threonine protein phosphatase PrpC